MNLSPSKHNLRQEAKSHRKALSVAEIENYSLQIAKQVDAYFSFRGKRISCFLSMESQHEVITEFLIKNLECNNQLFVPVSNFKEGTMIQVPYNLGDPVEYNAYQIPEPSIQLYPILPTELDVVVLPLLQADVRGNRLGYGKGFYDKYLAMCRPNIIKIGLNFFDPIQDIPRDETDIPLNYLITPVNVYEFK